MTPKKKIEIIIESIQTNKIIALLEKLQISGYSVINGVVGKGTHGYHDSKGLSNVLSNSYIMTICSQEEADKIILHIKPLISRYGGIGLLSDSIVI